MPQKSNFLTFQIYLIQSTLNSCAFLLSSHYLIGIVALPSPPTKIAIIPSTPKLVPLAIIAPRHLEFVIYHCFALVAPHLYLTLSSSHFIAACYRPPTTPYDH